MLNSIINELKGVKGLNNINLLTKKDINFIKKNEEKRNIGVSECLKRKYVLVLTHNSKFREPEEKIVRFKNNKLILPAVKFSEVKTKNVVSSSPSKEIHNYLVKKFKLKLKDEATLLIGFDE